jgi:outer membrane receptor for ferric coprogen and ferric-rhodotorulic acid
VAAQQALNRKAAEAIGYFQSNVISGTRLNSRIEDLGQSITVMTKAQMQDFAMTKCNVTLVNLLLYEWVVDFCPQHSS